tara:strand:+ start:13 stop:2283 length:2271 start_codon:yes stop_codon:yes gene_type:complete
MDTDQIEEWNFDQAGVTGLPPGRQLKDSVREMKPGVIQPYKVLRIDADGTTEIFESTRTAGAWIASRGKKMTRHGQQATDEKRLQYAISNLLGMLRGRSLAGKSARLAGSQWRWATENGNLIFNGDERSLQRVVVRQVRAPSNKPKSKRRQCEQNLPSIEEIIQLQCDAKSRGEHYKYGAVPDGWLPVTTVKRADGRVHEFTPGYYEVEPRTGRIRSWVKVKKAQERYDYMKQLLDSDLSHEEQLQKFQQRFNHKSHAKFFSLKKQVAHDDGQLSGQFESRRAKIRATLEYIQDGKSKQDILRLLVEKHGVKMHDTGQHRTQGGYAIYNAAFDLLFSDDDVRSRERNMPYPSTQARGEVDRVLSELSSVPRISTVHREPQILTSESFAGILKDETSISPFPAYYVVFSTAFPTVELSESIDHINQNHKDNSAFNLETVTIAENSRRGGKSKKLKRSDTSAKITAKSRPVQRCDLETGEVVQAYASIAMAIDDMVARGHQRTSMCHISEVVRGGRDNCGGFGWKWATDTLTEFPCAMRDEYPREIRYFDQLPDEWQTEVKNMVRTGSVPLAMTNYAEVLTSFSTWTRGHIVASENSTCIRDDRYALGNFRFSGVFTYRLMWVYFNGPIPDGKVLGHKDGDESDPAAYDPRTHEDGDDTKPYTHLLCTVRPVSVEQNHADTRFKNARIAARYGKKRQGRPILYRLTDTNDEWNGPLPGQYAIAEHLGLHQTCVGCILAQRTDYCQACRESGYELKWGD